MSRCGGAPDMWRKITRFALAALGALLGWRGFSLIGAEDPAAKAASPLKRLFSAIAPMLNAPPWAKKWRRVIARARSTAKCWWRFIIVVIAWRGFRRGSGGR